MNQNSYQQFYEAAIELNELLDQSGSILYSPLNTLTKGDYYLLGINPGGKGGDSIQEHLSQLSGSTRSAYYADDWDSNTLQKRLVTLFKHASLNLDNICSSNLIFLRSVSEGQLPKSRYAKGELIDKCWKVHKVILGIVQPKYIVTFGKLPYTYVSTKLGMKETATKPAGHGKWLIRIAKSTYPENEQYIISFPHLSRYAPAESILKDILHEFK
jgi:hypothetical protein